MEGTVFDFRRLLDKLLAYVNNLKLLEVNRKGL